MSITFRDARILKAALLHKSAAPQATVSAFERMEFLGDRVLGLVISQWLYNTHPEDTEANLALRLSHLTDRSALCYVGKRLELLTYVKRAKPSRQSKAAGEDKIIADSMEALLGALFLDKGLNHARSCIKRWWKPLLTGTSLRAPQQDAKSALQEWAQSRYGILPVYRIVHKKGPEHAPRITVSLTIPHKQATQDGIPHITTTEASRKKAEQKAAQALLRITGTVSVT